MSEQLLPQQIRLSLNDASGTPLPGGSVTFFETGTTDLADIWADEAASVPLANPVVADAAGRIVQVFFTAGYGVKAVIKTAAGVTVDTLDPCPRFSGTASAASAISFAPITGNAATNVQAAIANNTAEATVARAIVNGGTGATSAAGARANLGLGGLATLDILDEDNFASDSATRPPSQQSTKAFIETAVSDGNALKLLSRTVISGSPTVIDLVWNESLYDTVIVTLANVEPSTDGVAFQLRTSSDGGATFDSGASDYRFVYSAAYSTTLDMFSGSGSLVNITRLSAGTAAGEEGSSGSITVFGPGVAKRTRINASILSTSSANALNMQDLWAERQSSAVVNGLRLLLGSGTFAGGTITMHGVKSS